MRKFIDSTSEDGFTLVELMLSLVITAILAVGVTRVLTITVQSVNYTQSATLVASNSALIDSVLSEDIAASNGFIIPNTSTTSPDTSKICSSWKATDATYATVRPLLTLSVPNYLPITNATGNGSTITYTLSMGFTNTFQLNQLVTIYGFTNANLISTSAKITARSDQTALQAGTFTVVAASSTTETETPTKVGTAVVNWYHGYEVRKADTVGEIWLFSCPTAGYTGTLINPRVLRQGVALPNDSNWSLRVKCTKFDTVTSPTITSITVTEASATSTTCPTNTSLTSLSDNPGIQFIVPPAKPGSRSNQYYKTQVIQGARSVA